jgi:hypothetical protein
MVADASGRRSLSDRIVGAFTFRRGVYADVEKDPSFTPTAWLIVAVISFLSRLGLFAAADPGNWIVSALVGTVLAVIGFAIAAWIIAAVARGLFGAQVTFEELVRTLGLAYVWNIVGVVGILAAFSGTLSCLLSPVFFIAAILGLLAWFVAAKEALDLGWGQTIIAVFLGWLAWLVLGFITNVILGILGIQTPGVGGFIQG